MIRRLFLVAALAAAGPASAQSPPVEKARGTITAISGDLLTVAARDGATREVRLGDKTRVAVATKASLADLQPNVFVGMTSAPDAGAEGGEKALEIHIFPEALRGTGEGTRAYDLAPRSAMTNGALSIRVGSVANGELTVTYRGGSRTVRLPPDTPIVALAPGNRGDLVVGAGIVATGRPAEGGAIDAGYVVVGKGVMPPM